MIQWNKGEPPKDGEWYLVMLQNHVDEEVWRSIDAVSWDGEKKWGVGWNWCPFGKGKKILAWSEINLPEEP